MKRGHSKTALKTMGGYYLQKAWRLSGLKVCEHLGRITA